MTNNILTQQLEVFTGGVFPRCMAFPYRCDWNRNYFIVNFVDEMIAYVRNHDSVNCYCTMYAFEEYTQTTRNANSAIINSINFDLDSTDLAQALFDAKKIVQWAKRHGVQPLLNFSGSKGFHIYLPIVPVKLKYPRRTLEQFTQELQESAQLATIDTVVTKDLNRVLRLPGTLHKKTGRYCAPIDVDILPYIEINDIIKVAQSPPTYVPERIESFGEVRNHLIEIDNTITQNINTYKNTMNESAVGNIMTGYPYNSTCPAVENLLKNGAQLGTLDMCIVGIICAKRDSQDILTLEKTLHNFNKKCDGKITCGHIAEKIKYHYYKNFRPCSFLRDICPECATCAMNKNWVKI